MADVEAVIFLREPKEILAANPQRKLPVKTIGLAPLTSMFWFGKNSERKFDDYRQEVHDSRRPAGAHGQRRDALAAAGQSGRLRHQVFSAPNIRGFGLLQRERSFAAYQDMFNLFQLEPSVWVEPHGDWGEGDLHLVELSANYEGLDNIVAFWDPKNKPAPMQPYRFGYTLCWENGEADLKLSENRVVSTRIGLDSDNANTRVIHD